MSLFVDNNILIGYIFGSDNWSIKSSEVMRCNLKKFSSDTVKRECHDIYNKNVKKIRFEIQKIIREINKSKSIKPKKLLKFIDQFYSKDEITKYINTNHQEDKNTFNNGLRKLIADMELRCLINLQNLDNLITFCIRNLPYKEIYDIFKADGLVQIDPSDVEIIIDAHHVGLKVKDLILISGDYKHIIPRKELIKNNTSLKDVIGTGEFNL